MNSEFTILDFLILVFAFIAITCFSFVILGLIFFGTVSGFELTEQMKSDQYLVVTCQTYKLNNTSCDEVYGAVPFP